MKSVLIEVRSDPAASPRAAEAFRLAVGLHVGLVEVAVAVPATATACLGGEAFLLEEGDLLVAHRDRFLRAGGEILAEGPEGEAPEGVRWLSPDAFARRLERRRGNGQARIVL